MTSGGCLVLFPLTEEKKKRLVFLLVVVVVPSSLRRLLEKKGECFSPSWNTKLHTASTGESVLASFVAEIRKQRKTRKKKKQQQH
jgi:hypothetical protein